MMSTFPAMLPADGFLGTHFGFTPWEYQENPFVFSPPEPIFSNFDSDNFSLNHKSNSLNNSKSTHPNLNQDEATDNPNAFSPPEPIFSNSGSDNSSPNHKPNNSNNSESNHPSPNQDETTAQVDERKRRRMISNRESARRSRMRKQRHLENLRNQVNRLKVGNREIMNRLRLVRHHSQLVRQENEWLRRESAALQQKLWDIRQVLLVRQLLPTPAWPCNNLITSINEQINPTIINYIKKSD